MNLGFRDGDGFVPLVHAAVHIDGQIDVVAFQVQRFGVLEAALKLSDPSQHFVVVVVTGFLMRAGQTRGRGRAYDGVGGRANDGLEG